MILTFKSAPALGLEDDLPPPKNDSKGLFIENGALVLSRLFHKYSNEFGRNKVSQLSSMKSYIVPGTLKKINAKMPVRYQFDWSLNDGTGMLDQKL